MYLVYNDSSCNNLVIEQFVSLKKILWINEFQDFNERLQIFDPKFFNFIVLLKNGILIVLWKPIEIIACSFDY